MHKVQELLCEEETRYKKKSKAKGLPRSKHKHTYQTVLLKCYHTFPDFRTGKPRTTFTELPTKSVPFLIASPRLTSNLTDE